MRPCTHLEAALNLHHCAQVAVLKSATVANEAMHMQLSSLQRELTAAQAAVSAAGNSQQRTYIAEKAAADARLEAQNALAAAAAMEERVQNAEEEMDRVAGTLTPAPRIVKQRMYHETASGRMKNSTSKGSAHPRGAALGEWSSSTWPTSVRTHVMQREPAAAEVRA